MKSLKTFIVTISAVSVLIIPSSSVLAKTTLKSGPTALCKDGTYSYALHHQGACSHHKGVKRFYK